ncbi:hypothetical protein IC781_12230 [Acinetobacter seifertii]|nr:hypothetical protein IC781_12230 [Acinetobacter seifertii]
MSILIKFLLIIFMITIPLRFLYADNDMFKYHAVAAYITGKVYSCEYKITYANYEKQQVFENVAYRSLPFIYKKVLHSVYQRETYSKNQLSESSKNNMERDSILLPPNNLNIKVDFDVKMDNQVYNIKLTPSTGSESLDRSIKNAFSSAKIVTHKKFWWGDTLAFSDEIRLVKVNECQVRNLH